MMKAAFAPAVFGFHQGEQPVVFVLFLPVANQRGRFFRRAVRAVMTVVSPVGLAERNDPKEYQKREDGNGPDDEERLTQAGCELSF